MPGFELFGEEERREVNAVMQTGVLARYGFEHIRNDNWKAQDFEQALCRYFDCSYAQLVCNGTAALTTALAAMNIGAGHEVILPVFCDVSCFEAIITVGAIPVFADIDETLCMNAATLKELITPSTKAVLLVHVAGNVGDVQGIQTICTEHNLFLLEDFSQAIGATINGRYVGTFGHAAVASFDFYSTITCGEGGVVLTNDPNLYKLCNEYSDHGHDHLGSNRNSDQHRYIGTNYRISELHAAVGLAQLRKLPFILERQRLYHNVFKTNLNNVEGIAFSKTLNEVYGSDTHFSILLPSEQKTLRVVAALENAKIPFMYWYNNKWHYIKGWEHFKNGSWMNRLYDDHKKRILQHSNLVFPASDAIMSRCISFAISLSAAENEMKQRATQIAEVINETLAAYD